MGKKILCKMYIYKKNEVYLILKDLDQSTLQELTSYFTFEVPGAKFMPMVRNMMWDGNIRLFSPSSGEIYVGLLPYIKKFCDYIKITLDEFWATVEKFRGNMWEKSPDGSWKNKICDLF